MSAMFAKSRLPIPTLSWMKLTSFVPQYSKNMPSRNAKSPMRLTTNALRPAVANASFSYQNPISKNEHRPTPSQPMNMTGMFAARTRISIAPMNRFR